MAAKKAAKKQARAKEDYSGILVGAGVFLGMGFGFLFNNLVAGIFLGLGCGMLAKVLVKRGTF